MQMRLTRLLRIFDALFHDILRLLDELPMQVYRVLCNASRRIVLAEDVVGRLLVVLVAHLGMLLGLVGEFLRGRAIASLVGLLASVRQGLLLRLLLPGEIAEPVVLPFGVIGGGMIERLQLLARLRRRIGGCHVHTSASELVSCVRGHGCKHNRRKERRETAA